MAQFFDPEDTGYVNGEYFVRWFLQAGNRYREVIMLSCRRAIDLLRCRDMQLDSGWNTGCNPCPASKKERLILLGSTDVLRVAHCLAVERKRMALICLPPADDYTTLCAISPTIDLLH